MEIKNNPTGRLLDLMVVARGCADNSTTRKVWASVFGCAPDDTGAILSGLAGLINLVAQAKAATEKHVSRNVQLFLEPFPKLESMLSRISLDTNWQSSRAFLDDRTITTLEFGDHELTAHFGSALLDEDLISQFLHDLDGLVQQCATADVPEALKLLFRKNLEDLRGALLAYRISGVTGLQDEIDRIFGSFGRHGQVIEESWEEGQTQDLTSRVFHLIGRLNDSIQLAETAVSYGTLLTAPLANLLLQNFGS